MKWFKHDTNARHDTRLKLLKKKYGAEGYGVYFQLLEIIGENIKDNNQKDWGFVEEIHTIETLADESGVSPDKLRTMLRYMNEVGLVYKLEHRLCVPKILRRLDEYAQKRKAGLDVIQREIDLSGQCRDSVGTVSGECRGLDKIRLDKIRTDISINTNGDKSPVTENKTEFGNEHVNLVLEEFTKLYGFKPTDKFPRRTAHTLTSQLTKILKDRKKNAEAGNVSVAIRSYFSWVSKQDWAENIQSLDTVRRKLPIFEAQLPKVDYAK